jgi:hypothetical protein
MIEAKKDSLGKPDLGLLVSDLGQALEELANCCSYGAEKYGRHNWRLHGDMDDKYLSAALRHIFKHVRGESFDAESGKTHLAHAAWSILACLQKHISDDTLTK